jgi:hypothetical protein
MISVMSTLFNGNSYNPKNKNNESKVGNKIRRVLNLFGLRNSIEDDIVLQYVLLIRSALCFTTLFGIEYR